MPFFLYICRMRETLSDIALYHEYKATTDTNSLLSERTWEDLNLDDFFLFADHTSSCVGRQYLYDVLHYNRTSEVAGQEKMLDSLSADAVLRRDIQNELKKLNHVLGHSSGQFTFFLLITEGIAIHPGTFFGIIIRHLFCRVSLVNVGRAACKPCVALS